MTIKNKLYNWWHGVKRVRTKGSKNVGRYADSDDILVKYDWEKPMAWLSRPINFKIPLRPFLTKTHEQDKK